MLSLIPEYIAMDLLIGLGLGTLSGIAAAIFFSLKVNQNPANFLVVLAFIAALFVFYLAGLFPLSVIVATLATMTSLWVALPVFFGKGTAKDIITDIEERIVETVSTEGRQSVLEELGIIQPMS